MKLLPACSILLLLLVFLAKAVSPCYAGGAAEGVAIWSDFLARQDVVWNRPFPERWNDAFLLGNGRLGATIYRDDRSGEVRWVLGRKDVTDHRGNPTQGEKEVLWMRPRLPIGHFVWDIPGQVEDGTSRLALWNAEAKGEFATRQGSVRWRSFMHATQPVLVVEWKGDADNKASFRFEPAESGVKKFTPEDYKPNPPARRMEIDGIAVSVQPMLAGGEYAVAWKTVVADDGTRRLYASIGNSWVGTEARTEAVQAVQEAIEEPFAQLLQSHRKWWHDWYPKAMVSLSDPLVENYYWLALYISASATRGDRLPMDLLGPWPEPDLFPWPAVWWNRNIQECYYGLAAGNRSDLAMSLVNMLIRNKKNLALNTGEFADDSYAIGHVSSWNCRSDVKQPWYEPGNFLRALHQAWQVYDHTRDDDLLREHLFDLLRGAVNYYRHDVLFKREGKWHLRRTTCPEYGPAPNCNYDLGWLKWALGRLLWANERLDLDDPLAQQWQDIQENLVDYPQDEHGFMKGSGVTFSYTQHDGQYRRQYSTMIAFYPLQLVNWSNPEDRDLIRRSLDWYVGGAMQEQGWGGLAPNPMAAAGAWYALADQPDKGLTFLHRYLKYQTWPNGLSRERSPLGGTHGVAFKTVQDFLIQYRNETIHILTAVPSSWSDVSIRDLRAPGAFLIDAVRKDGEVRFIRITSQAGEPCKLRTGIKGPVVAHGGKLTELSEGEYRLWLEKGQTALLFPRGQQPEDPTIRPVEQAEAAGHWWGSKSRAFRQENR